MIFDSPPSRSRRRRSVWLAAAVLSAWLGTAEQGVAAPPAVVAEFTSGVKLVAAEVPDRSEPERSLRMRLSFEIPAGDTTDYWVLVYLDAGAVTQRHAYGTLGSSAVAAVGHGSGRVVSTVTLKAGPSGDYTLWLSLRHEARGRDETVPVRRGPADAEDRVRVAELCVGPPERCPATRSFRDSVDQHRTGAEPIGIRASLRSPWRGAAPPKRLEIASRAELLAFLARPDRVLAVAPARELCALAREASPENGELELLDYDRSWVLLTNRLAPGERDLDLPVPAVTPTEPSDVEQRRRACFGDAIELLGFDLPAFAVRGDTFQVTLYFRVVGHPPPRQRVFVHLGGPSVDLQTEHSPAGGLCDTELWQPGDFIVDRFFVRAGRLDLPKGTHSVWVGFFDGSPGRGRNLPVTCGRGDADNRVRLGELVVR